MTCRRMACWYWMNDIPKHRPKLNTAPRDPRREVLAQWRGVDLAPMEIARQITAKSLAQVMPNVLREMRLDRRRSDVEILKAWNELLDPNVTAHAQPVNLYNGTLFVSVDNSVWLSEVVRYRRQEILDRLQHCFGKDLITKISFRVG